MVTNKEIRNVAIVGTGVIGASWAALYLARGLSVVATDPAGRDPHERRIFPLFLRNRAVGDVGEFAVGFENECFHGSILG